MSLLRPNIEQMAGYQPGEQPREAGFIKLNTNENPYPPSPRVIDALRRNINETLRLYPDPMATAVREKAAGTYGFRPEQILVGNGSDDLLTIIMRAFVAPGEVVAYPMPSYTLYRTLAQIQDARAVEVPFPHDYSLPAGLRQTAAKVVFLANPNSPSGTVIPPSEVAALADALVGILVVDEAYVDFAEADALHLARERQNVIVLRTFSKSFSLCGLRVGLAFGHADLIAGMAKVKDSYNVNRLGIVAAVAALDDIEHMRANAEKIRQTRARLTRELERLGAYVWPSQANFVLARFPAGEGRPTAAEIYARLKERRILVRHFNQPRLEDCLRISVGSDREVDILLERLWEIWQPAAGSLHQSDNSRTRQDISPPSNMEATHKWSEP